MTKKVTRVDRAVDLRRQAEELRECEDNLANRHESLKSILDSLDSLVYVVDFNSYEILFINKYGRDIWGDIQGRKCWQTIQKDRNGPCSFCTNDKLLSDAGTPTGVYQWEFQNTVTGRWYECRDQAISWIGKALVRMEIATDITVSKKADKEKEILEAQNRQLHKFESLRRLAGAIAHHFNNQLGVVIGNLEMAIDELPFGDILHENITAAMEASSKAAQMSSMMLTYLGQSFDKREPLDISYTCLRGIPMLNAVMPGNVAMKTDLPSPGPIIMGNTSEIQQVVNNLIINAWEAVGKDSGTVSLSIKTVTSAEIPTVHRAPVDWQLPDKTFACFEVTDTGCGIEDNDIEKLFDPFFTTKLPGRGMGLAVVLGIVKAHNGVITVKSKPGSGSTFLVFFPITEEALKIPQKAKSKDDSVISAVSTGKFEEGGTVLVVEDEEPLRRTIATMLTRMGFSVLAAKDGVEALEVFHQHQSEIKFVLSDLTMPRMNGWETLTALRKIKPDIPVILASGYDKAQVMSGDHSERPQAFLGKPYNREALSGAIRKAMTNDRKARRG